MTDIRQHFPLVLSCVRQHLATPGPIEMLHRRLRELLPASYGVDAGLLVTARGQQSHPFDVIIYDKTLLQTHPITTSSCYDIRLALVIIKVTYDIESVMLTQLLQDIANARLLLPPASAQNTQKPARAFKRLLPLGIIACQRVTDLCGDDLTTHALALDNLLKSVEERLRPDYLIVQSLQLSYSNPLLAGNAFTAETMNIAHDPEMKKAHPCYVCKQRFTTRHFFYEYLCLRCGDLNYQKRAFQIDLSGRLALVTGGRVKIGYATALRLLRAGAYVIVTTRFPHDAARRYANEPDFATWQDRLQIYGIDFRYLPVVQHFIAHMHATYPALDILINNAAQTVRYPQEHYAPLLPFERLPLADLAPALQKLVQHSHETLPPTPFALAGETVLLPPTQETSLQTTSAHVLHDYGAAAVLSSHAHSQLEDSEAANRQIQSQNSWTLPIDEIDLTEFLEVQIINVTTPFLLVNRLLPLLRRSAFPQRFIINVSAVEGQFANSKQGTHVHTNMAKASLNMLTHTAAAQLARNHIFMNSVDPGWISQQAPLTDLQAWERIQRLLPLDLVDAAARICDPIFTSIASGDAPYGGFYKDYQRTTW